MARFSYNIFFSRGKKAVTGQKKVKFKLSLIEYSIIKWFHLNNTFLDKIKSRFRANKL